MASRQDDVRAVLDQVKAEGRTSLTAPECKAACDAYGIPVPREGLATSAAEAAAIGTEIGYPIVMKIVSPDILHKTEAGGVLVGVADENAAKAGYERIVSSAKAYKSDADIAGVQVQAMVAGGGQVRTGVRAGRATPTTDGWRIDIDQQEPLDARFLVGCAGLHADRVAQAAGERPDVRILPFRGEYLDVTGPSADLVRGLVYPVPDPRFPFLGVHLTRGLDDAVHAGPNAILALAREGYRWSDVAIRDLLGTAAWPGTARLVARYWRPGLAEVARSISRDRFVTAARRLIPDLDRNDLRRAPAGVRAQAVNRSGALLDDFTLLDGDRSLHVLNAPSPAATASLEIGALVAERVAQSVSGPNSSSG